MKKPFKYLCVLLGGVVAGCNGGGSGSSDEAQLNAIQDQIRNVYFYRSDDAIKAIDYNDPTNPITIEPASSSLTAFTAQEVLTPFGSNPTRYYASSGSLVYAKNGQFWHVDNNVASNLSPRQLSNESNANRVCRAKPVYNTSNQTLHHYALPGPSGNCSYVGYEQDPNNNGVRLPVFPDMIYKWLTLDMDAASPPNSGSYQAINPYIDRDIFYESSGQDGTITIQGVLTLDDSGNLLWFEGTDFSAPRHTVASGVTSFNMYFIPGKDWRYVFVDGSFYSYSPGAASLGTSLYQLNSPQYTSWYYDLEADSEFFYILDGDRLIQFSTTTPGSPNFITEDSRFQDFYLPFGETDTHLYFRADWQFGSMLYSVELATGTVTELITADKVPMFPSGPPSIYGILSNDKIYYTDTFTEFTRIVSLNGDEIRTFPGMWIHGYVYSPIIESAQDTLTHLLLSQPIDANSDAILALDVENDSMPIQLGTAPPYIFRLAEFTRQYDGKIIIFPANEFLIANHEIFFADLNQENSLVQLTDDTTVDVPINSSWTDPGPLVPASSTP